MGAAIEEMNSIHTIDIVRDTTCRSRCRSFKASMYRVWYNRQGLKSVWVGADDHALVARRLAHERHEPWKSEGHDAHAWHRPHLTGFIR